MNCMYKYEYWIHSQRKQIHKESTGSPELTSHNAASISDKELFSWWVCMFSNSLFCWWYKSKLSNLHHFETFPLSIKLIFHVWALEHMYNWYVQGKDPPIEINHCTLSTATFDRPVYRPTCIQFIWC